jgi:hypothetical protein
MSYFNKIKLTDVYGFAVENTPMGEQRVVIPTRLVGATFNGATADPNFWTPTIANSATVAQANNQIVLDCGTNAAGSITYTSVRTARYVGGSSMRYRSQVQLGDTGIADNSRKWGVRNATTDGAYFELDGTTMYIVTLKGSTPTRVASASWNTSTTVPTLTDCNTYEIYWTNKKVYFSINDVLVHVVTANAATWSATCNFQVFQANTNAGNTASKTMSVRVASIYILGSFQTAPIYKNIAGATVGTVLKYGPGVLHKVILNTTGGTSTVLYDNVSAGAPAIATVLTGAVTSLSYDVPFSTGLTVVQVGAACDITYIYE